MIRAVLLALAVLAAAVAPRAHAIDLQPALRLSAWSSDRLASDDPALANAEIWLRGAGKASENLSWRLEAMAATDPIGRDEAGGDLREAFLRLRGSGLQLRAGRQIYAWGRADRLNPTDVIAPRDYRRLVEDDGDDRRGVAAFSVEAEILGGAASVHWLPEFRRTEIPTPLEAPGILFGRRAPDDTTRQFAIRYERFSERIDWSISYAQINDRLPWLALRVSAAGPVLEASHPKTTMWGADIAATVGKIGVRAEAAYYDRDLAGLGASAARVPRAAAVLGVDRSFPGQLNINLQGVARFSTQDLKPAQPFAAVSARNAVIQGAWRDVTLGATARVRKAFAQDRGAIEGSLASFSGGGRFAQLKLSFAVRDGLRVGLLAERFDGPSESLFGRLERNSLIAASIRKGF